MQNDIADSFVDDSVKNVKRQIVGKGPDSGRVAPRDDVCSRDSGAQVFSNIVNNIA
jgi:hypothetical protein